MDNMKDEEKALLLKDLCSRLPYGVICRMSGGGFETIEEDKLTAIGFFQFVEEGLECVPYLRPMSSMTEDEYNEYENYILNEKDELIRFCNSLTFYNKYHFDYCGLIEKGLALEAPEGMYNF